MSASTLRIGVLMPEVLGTYGDSGNALILAERARRRGIDAEIVHVGLNEEIPDSLDIYTLGEDQRVATVAVGAQHLGHEDADSQRGGAHRVPSFRSSRTLKSRMAV